MNVEFFPKTRERELRVEVSRLPPLHCSTVQCTLRSRPDRGHFDAHDHPLISTLRSLAEHGDAENVAGHIFVSMSPEPTDEQND